jgi:hypothetical protein
MRIRQLTACGVAMIAVSSLAGSAFAQEQVRVNVDPRPWERTTIITNGPTSLTTILRADLHSATGPGTTTRGEGSRGQTVDRNAEASYAVSTYFARLIGGLPIIEKMNRLKP